MRDFRFVLVHCASGDAMNSDLRRRLKALANDLTGPLGPMPFDRATASSCAVRGFAADGIHMGADCACSLHGGDTTPERRNLLGGTSACCSVSAGKRESFGIKRSFSGEQASTYSPSGTGGFEIQNPLRDGTGGRAAKAASQTFRDGKPGLSAG